ASTNDALAQPFMMPAAGTIDWFDVLIGGPAGSQYTLWLTNQVGAGTTWSNVIATYSATWGGGNDYLTVPVDQLVDGGQYYLILSVTQGTVYWFFGNPSVGSMGSSDQIAVGAGVDQGFIPASNFYQYSSPLTFA